MSTIQLFSASTDKRFHQSFRGAMAREKDITLCDEVDPLVQLLYLAQDVKPDIFLLDWQLQCQDCSLLLTKIKNISPDTKTLLFCDICGQQELTVALTHGTQGLVQKTSPPELWVRAVRKVASGELWFGRKLLMDTMATLCQRQNPQECVMNLPVGVLTEREQEVARWVSRGMSNKEIARKLTISDATVKSHMQHIFSKLHVDRRVRILSGYAPSFSAGLPLSH